VKAELRHPFVPYPQLTAGIMGRRNSVSFAKSNTRWATNAILN
jgi:hypothetical protein